MKSRISFFTLSFLLLNCINPVNAQQTEQQAVIKTDYLVYLPAGYNAEAGKKWPVMFYLHGAGLKDRSIEGLRNDYIPWHLDHDKALPFIVVSPVCRTNGWDVTILNFLLEDVISKFKVDEDRIFVTGHSMGGFGTWDWAIEDPGRFAAIAPVSGCSNSRDSISAWKLRNLPIWVFHGETDNIVGIGCNTEMVNELKKFSTKVKFTVYPNRGHDTWEQTYTNDELFSWMAEQDRKNNIPVAVNLDEKIYKSYSGLYLLDNDTLAIGYAGKKLFVQPSGGEQVNLLPESELIFSIEENPSFGIMFHKEKGKITGFNLLDNTKRFARRIDLK
jgi:poly(3-hydroxybutyrate) depolymerase